MELNPLICVRVEDDVQTTLMSTTNRNAVRPVVGKRNNVVIIPPAVILIILPAVWEMFNGGRGWYVL